MILDKAIGGFLPSGKVDVGRLLKLDVSKQGGHLRLGPRESSPDTPDLVALADAGSETFEPV
jgi:hypothetical protein